MCRLFGLHAGSTSVTADFWLLDAPDNLSDQSHRNPDGFGIGTFSPDGTPVVEKAPQPAWADTEFATAAHTLHGRTFLAHVRKASTGALTTANTHPFLQDGRLFAHNGVVAGLDVIERRLEELEASSLVQGATDSERLFALLTAEARLHHGDVTAGTTAALTWLNDRVPIYALNFILTTATEVWAFRYPEQNTLFVLARPGTDADSDEPLHARGSRLAARAHHLAARPSVIVASERMDDSPDWRSLEPGELLHIHEDLTVESTHPLTAPPAHRLFLADLTPAAATSQRFT